MKERKIREEELVELDIYTDDGVFSYHENDGISAAEEGFMIGYLAA